MATSGFRFGNLTNSIHPIFRRDNFAVDLLVDYEILTPALQLASRLITPPTPLSFWHTIISGATRPEKFYIYPLRQGEEYHYEFCNHSPTLTDEQILKTEAKLIGLADRVQFELNEEDVSETKTWVMTTERLHTDDSRAIIKIPSRAMLEVQNAAMRFALTGDDVTYTVSAFQFAKTIVHELAHAAYVTSYSENEYCYFPGSAVCEEGFSWENEIFSGLIDIEKRPDSEDESPEVFYPYITPWPNPYRVTKPLIDDDDCIGIRLRHSSALLPKAKTDNSSKDHYFFHYIDFSFLEKLFTEDFWTNDMITQGPSALHPKLDEEDRRTREVTPQIAKALTETYNVSMGEIVPYAREHCTPDQYEQLRRLCEPWEQFLAEYGPNM